MMEKEITALQVQKKNAQRVNVFLDGEFAFGLSRLTAAWLTVGRKLSDAEINKLQSEDELEVAWQKALRFLGFRPRTTQEITRYLEKKGFSDVVVTTTLTRLQEQNFVNDKAFAELWIENRSTFRPRSHRLLSRELRQKGVTNETIQNVLEDTVLPEEELAYKAATKLAQRYQSLDWQTFRQKFGGFLARRGFSYGVSISVIKRLWNEIQQPDSEAKE